MKKMRFTIGNEQNFARKFIAAIVFAIAFLNFQISFKEISLKSGMTLERLGIATASASGGGECPTGKTGVCYRNTYSSGNSCTLFAYWWETADCSQ